MSYNPNVLSNRGYNPKVDASIIRPPPPPPTVTPAESEPVKIIPEVKKKNKKKDPPTLDEILEGKVNNKRCTEFFKIKIKDVLDKYDNMILQDIL